MYKTLKLIISLALLFFLCGSSYGAEVKIAVASNFVGELQLISKEFKRKYGENIQLNIIPGSTGKHYAQIVQGAPFDVFLAADSKRPKMLIEKGVAVKNSFFVYALGQLVLWAPAGESVPKSMEDLNKVRSKRIALANPLLAPYGQAAKESLIASKIWKNLKGKFVYGENISQTFLFAKSGNAQLAFVALSQVLKTESKEYYKIPTHLYKSIRQGAVLLKQNNQEAKEFLKFLRSDKIKILIQKNGYQVE